MIHVEDDFTVAIPAAIFETGRKGVDRWVVQPHREEDRGEPEIPKARPAVGLKVACFRTGESFNELLPTVMARQ